MPYLKKKYISEIHSATLLGKMLDCFLIRMATQPVTWCGEYYL